MLVARNMSTVSLCCVLFKNYFWTDLAVVILTLPRIVLWRVFSYNADGSVEWCRPTYYPVFVITGVDHAYVIIILLFSSRLRL